VDSSPQVLIDGRPGQVVHWNDRGLQYGDGLFETVAVRCGQPLLWAAHLARLWQGCSRFGIPAPDAQLLADEARTISAEVRRGVLKLLLTRGSGGRGYRPPEDAHPTRILSIHSFPTYSDDFRKTGVSLYPCRTRLGLNPSLAGLKHLNRLEQVLGRREWNDPRIPEGLMRDIDGRVVEGTMTNLFIVRDGCLNTPDLSRCGVLGVMRGEVLRLARSAGVGATVTDLMPADLATADEVFVCNSLIGVWPVRKIGRHTYAPGLITNRLQSLVAGATVYGVT
jgi:4-amino-4-deoxychorismate lyase